MGLYVPIDLLVEMGARLATNGVILCRDKVPYTAIHAIFELKGSREMGPRIQSPSLVDEYVCETMQGQDFMNAGERYVMKVADMYKSDINVPFAFRKNIALMLQRVQNGVPTEAQAKELINHMTRAIIDSGHNYEGSCRWCPWCLNVVPASIIARLPCNVAWVSPALLIQRSSLKLRRKGWKRSANVGAELDVEEPELRATLHHFRLVKMKMMPTSMQSLPMTTSWKLMRRSTSMAKGRTLRRSTYPYPMTWRRNLLQFCLNTEEIGRTFDELFGYVIFQRREILDDYLSLSFTEMQAKVDDYFTPFASSFAPRSSIMDTVTKLPRAPTKDEVISSNPERHDVKQVLHHLGFLVACLRKLGHLL